MAATPQESSFGRGAIVRVKEIKAAFAAAYAAPKGIACKAATELS